jgi:TorA maturation chaperone TorD
MVVKPRQCGFITVLKRDIDMTDSEKEKIASKKRQENGLRLLAACFYEPEKELLASEKVFDNLRGCLDTICPLAVEFVDGMETAIERYSDEQLKVAYAKLFVGPFALAAAPYGSVYLDEGARVMGDSTMAVVKWYEQEGLVRSDDCKDLPDHIAIELEFVSYLICKEIGELENSDPDAAKAYANKQQSFSNELLCPWVPEFCEKIKQGTDNAFYTALAECASTVIGQELQLQGKA